jgi:uncharacterized protein
VSRGDLLLLIAVFFFTSVIGVVTGSNSLISVPAMFQAGIDPKVAIATNMFGLVFMAVGGTIPFVRERRIDVRRTAPLIAITLVGSALGAAIVGFISGNALKIVVSIAMFAVVAFTLVQRNRGIEREQNVSIGAAAFTYILVFLLAVYGGLYSGGYVTILTATLVAFHGYTYSESIAATKLINVFSSGVATLVFIWQGLVDYTLGMIIGVTMFVGAYFGAHYASRMNEVWLRRIFVATVLLLACKMLYDAVYA